MKIGVLTSSRADFGIYRPLLEKLRDSADFELKIIAFGGHLEDRLGSSLKIIQNEFSDIIIPQRTMEQIDSPDDVGKSMGLTTLEISKVLNETELDFLFCLGDRFEMLSAVVAASVFPIPIAHIHGGETTLGALDNKFRHAITNLADIHFTSCEEHSKKVQELIGSSDNIFNVGSISLHNIKTIDFAEKKDIENDLKIDLNKPTALITYHPVTNELSETESQVNELLDALSGLNYQKVFTGVNSDLDAEKIRKKIKKFVSCNEDCWYFENLGTKLYFSFMKNCSLMIGNTSSGIIEAATFNLPVVNIGNRQLGRKTSANVVHASAKSDEIILAVKKAEELIGKDFTNIYYQDDCLNIIFDVLNKVKKGVWK